MASVVDAMAGVDHAPKAARRRRERRLRAYVRDARMSVAMTLAEATHHTAPRGQRTASAREEEREVHCTAAFRTTVPHPERELFDLFEEPGGGAARLAVGAAEATAGGSAAHRNAHRGHLAVRADSRCAGAADGESGGGSAAEDRHGVSG